MLQFKRCKVGGPSGTGNMRARGKCDRGGDIQALVAQLSRFSIAMQVIWFQGGIHTAASRTDIYGSITISCLFSTKPFKHINTLPA